MIKSELVARLTARYPHLYHRDVERIVTTVLDSITKGIQQHEKVALAGFGTFAKKHRAARAGINPITKQPIQIAASKTCGFKAASALKAAL